MHLKDMSKEELELLSYTDLTNLILAENKKSMNTPTIFKKICDLLDFSEEDYMDKIGDFYTSLTIDKRFVLLENHEWDLREKHAIELVMDDLEEDENESEIEEETEEEIIEEDEDIISSEDELDTDDDDLDDLTIISEDEDEDENM